MSATSTGTNSAVDDLQQLILRPRRTPSVASNDWTGRLKSPKKRKSMTLQRRTIGALPQCLVVIVTIQHNHGQAGPENPAPSSPSKFIFQIVCSPIFGAACWTPSGPINCRAPPGNTALTSARSANSQTIGRKIMTGVRKRAQINRFDQFTTEIDGQTIYFIHERSPRTDAIPLILIHGWPGSILGILCCDRPAYASEGQQQPCF